MVLSSPGEEADPWWTFGGEGLLHAAGFLMEFGIGGVRSECEMEP